VNNSVLLVLEVTGLFPGYHQRLPKLSGPGSVQQWGLIGATNQTSSIRIYVSQVHHIVIKVSLTKKSHVYTCTRRYIHACLEAI